MSLITVKQAGGGDFTTIGPALAAVGRSQGAGANDTVEVYAGTYTETIDDAIAPIFPSGASWQAPFTLKAHSGDSVILKHAGELNLRLFAAYPFFSIITGIAFDGTNLDGIMQISFGASTLNANYVRFIVNAVINSARHGIIGGGAPGAAMDAGVEIIGNSFHDGALKFSGGSGSDFCYPVYWQGSNGLIDSNVFYNFPDFGIHSFHEGFTPVNNKITRNVLHDYGSFNPNNPPGPGTRGVAILVQGDGHEVSRNVTYRGTSGISLWHSRNTKTVHNTIYNQTASGILYHDSNGSNIQNNIIRSTVTPLDDAGTTSSIIISNNVTADPSFVNAAAGDFHLQAGSAAIDAGIPLTGFLYKGNAPDAGAFEWGAMQQWNASTKRWEILMPDSSIIAHSESHLLNPIQFGDWLFFLAASGNRSDGTSNGYYARQVSTGVQYLLNPNDQIGGPFEAKYDGSRYVTIAMRASQGKYYEHREVLAGIFDTSAKVWMDFSAQPLLNRFTPVANATVPNVLWVHNGAQSGGFEGSDPGAQVGRVTLISPTVVEWVTLEPNAQGAAIQYNCWRRTITVPTGAMSAITPQQPAHNVTSGAPIPAWL